LKHIIEILLATLLVLLIVITAGVAVWARGIEPVVNAALWNFASSSWDVKQNSGKELEETRKATAAAKALFDHTDIALNGPKAHPGLIPQLTVLTVKAQPAVDNLANVTSHLDLAVQHVDGAIQHLDALLEGGTATIAELQAAIKQVNAVIRDLDRQVTDPEIKESVANFAKASQNAAVATEQLAAIATDGRQVADKARETYLKPVNLWWGLVKTLLPLAGSAAQVVK
jgi:hypothetical protein